MKLPAHESAERSTALVDLVARAQRADASAFAELVRRFKAYAVALAFSRVADISIAEDISQEAFLDTYVHLRQLRDPAAFPGWFKRVLLKHSDRVLRRRNSIGVGTMGITTFGDVEIDPAVSPSERDAAHSTVWRAVAALPAHERLAVVLHHLLGEDQDAVAAFLDLKPGTLRKRLFSARRRMKEPSAWREARKEPSARREARKEPSAWREARKEPSARREARRETTMQNADTIIDLALDIDALDERVRYFIAVREGRLEAVRAMLETNPTLVNATEEWNPKRYPDGRLPVPTRATALIRAAGQGDVAMVKLLADHGADVDGDCGCAQHESPLWAAIAFGDRACAELLLERGANVECANVIGTTALQTAVIKQRVDLVELLLQHGADPLRVGAQGRSAVDWAAHKGNAELAKVLNRPRVATPSTTRHARGSSSDMIETGIRAIDLFAPIFAGDLVRTCAPPGSGALVLHAELARRFAETGAANVWVHWSVADWDAADIRHALGESTTLDAVQLLSVSSDTEDTAANLAETVAQLTSRTAGPVFVTLLQAANRLAESEFLFGFLKDRPPTSIWVVEPRDEQHSPAPLIAPFDAQVVLERRLARKHVFPAVDPLLSTSRHMTANRVGEAHVAIALRAAGLLKALRTWDATLFDASLDTLAEAERLTMHRARILQASFSQTFLTAEPFSGKPGDYSPLARTLEGTAAILDGAHDRRDFREFLAFG